MIKRGILVVLAFLQGAVCAEQILVARRLAVDVHAELLVATDDAGHALNWYNCGGLWGTFGDFGFDGPRSQYPRLGKVAGSEAVTFDGNDFLRLDTKAPETITSDGDFSIEAWVLNPSVQPRECVVSWSDGAGGKPVRLDYDFAGTVPKPGGWRHLALVHSKSADRCYVDGKLVRTRPSALELKPGGTIYLGCDPERREFFSGSLAAARIHEGAMTDAQVKGNFEGGVALGTKLLPNIHPKPRGSTFADPAKTPGLECRTSKHFRVCWFKEKDVKGVMPKRVPKQLADAEYYYEFYSKKLGMHLPIVSDRIENRGDGKKHLVEICTNWGGGNFGGHMPHGFGYPIQGPGFISGHELAHACQMHSMGCFPGNWWEAHANWMPEMAGHPHVHPVLNNLTSMFFCGCGRHYYHCWLIFVHLAETPEYGPLFVARMWHNCKRGEYLWNVARRIDPDPSTPMADEWCKMARRNITWDYKSHERYVTANRNPDMGRFGRVLLEPIAYLPGWWRVPREMAPQQFGYNLCPLKPTAPTVTIEFEGCVNPERGSDWRACFVAVDASGKPRYGDIWRGGSHSFAVKPDDKELYLVVAATPTKVMNIPMTGDYRSLEQHQFPYRVRLVGAEPLDVLVPARPGVPGKPHPNGGGFVAATAKVEPTAWVGPRAQVLERAQVLGRARIEDYAVVRGRAVVRDDAIVRGHALVQGNAVVSDSARVCDFAKVEGTVRDSALVLEHATIARGKTASGFAVAKGVAHVRGNIAGTAMVDGSYSKSNDLSRGVWFTWNWSTGKNPGELDKELGGLYAQYPFEKKHPYLAWDTYGGTHGLLVGEPQVVRGEKGTALGLNGRDQFVDVPRDVALARDFSFGAIVRWDGGASGQRLLTCARDARNRMFLTPSDERGRLALVALVNGSRQEVAANAPLPAGRWVHLAVVAEGDSASIYLDDKLVAENKSLTFNPEDLRATLAYLGRGLEGGFFDGAIEEASFYHTAIKDHTPPQPDPPQWAVPPIPLSQSEIIVVARRGYDPRGMVEYRFEELTSGASSDWQKEATWRHSGLKPGGSHCYVVRMRDINGNTTKPSPKTTVRLAIERPFVQSAEGLVVIEAEHFHRNTPAPDGHRWELTTNKAGYSGEGAMSSLPSRGANILSNYIENSPRLDYYVRFTKTGRHWLWVRANAPHYNADSIHAALDLKPEAWGQHFSTGWGGVYKWTRTRQPFEVKKPGVHILSIWMREDGNTLDRILLTTDPNYKPSQKLDPFKVPIGKGPPESRRGAAGGAR